MEVIKPRDNNKVIKYIILKNKLRCVCVNDDKIDKSYIVACVNVGSTGNKKYYDGMAHLLEHMCFITSKKYKEKGYVQNKATEFGGYTNAYTDDTNTVYYFEVFTKYLNEMVEIFSDYLFNSELNQEFILDELKNVDSEHKKNMTNDNFRIFNIEHLLCDKDSQYNSFFTGSLETLNKPDIRDKMVSFYNKYYVPENISICIVSNFKVDKIYTIIKNNFSNYKNNKSTPKISIKKPFYIENINKTFLINSVNKGYQFKYMFETHKINKYIKTKVFDYVGQLINTHMKNSLNDFLKVNNYIISLSAWFEHTTGIFVIYFDLTKKGWENIKKIDGYLRFYIDFILNHNFKDLNLIFTKIDKFNFANTIVDEPMDLAQSLAVNSFIYDHVDIYRGPYMILEYNEKHIKDLKKFIDFDNCIQLLITDKFEEKKYLTDPHYNTKYKQIKKIVSKPIKFDIEIDFKNNYLGSNLSIIKKLKNEEPVEISNNMWFGNTSKFDEKINYSCIIFTDDDFFCSPKNIIYSSLSLEILGYLLNRDLWDAIYLGYSCSINLIPSRNEIAVQFSLLNDKHNAQKFINHILDMLIDKNLNDISHDFIRQKLHNIQDRYTNVKNLSPWEYVNYLQDMYYSNSYDYKIMLKEIGKFNIEEFKVYFGTLFNKSKCLIFTYGNIETNYNFNQIKNNISKYHNFAKFNEFKTINAIHPNSHEKDNCIKVLLKIGEYNELILVHMYITSLIVGDIFYNKLRTDKQLGYLVSFSDTKIDNNYYFIEKIQSKFDLEHLYSHIKEFNSNILEYIKDININIWIDTLKNHLKVKDNNIGDAYNKYYSEIVSREFNFKRNIKLLSKIKLITKKSLYDFITKYIINNKKISVIKLQAS